MLKLQPNKKKPSEEDIKDFERKARKIQLLLELTDKEFKKKFNLTSTISLDVEISCDFLLQLKKFYQFYLLCLIELCNKLGDIGLGFASATLLQLFQTFKLNMAFFMKFNVFFFKMKNFYKEDKASNENAEKNPENHQENSAVHEFTGEQLAMLRKFLVKQKQSQQINANKYEKIEKARFYLDQEAQELEEMLVLFSAAKDEVDEFLQKKRNINSFKASGVTKFLQNLLRDTRTQTVNMNFELEIENKVLDRRELAVKDDKIVDEIKQEIISVFDHSQRKFLRQIRSPAKKRSSLMLSSSTGLPKNAETQTEEDFLANAGKNPPISLSKQYAAVSSEKNELLSKNEFLDNQLKSSKQRNFALEKRCEEFEAQKDALKLSQAEMELKLQRKKARIAELKRENEEILKKLEGLVDRDSANKQLLKQKHWENHHELMVFEEKQQSFFEEKQRILQENEALKQEIRQLQALVEEIRKELAISKAKLEEEFMRNKKNQRFLENFAKNRGQMLRKSQTFENANENQEDFKGNCAKTEKNQEIQGNTQKNSEFQRETEDFNEKRENSKEKRENSKEKREHSKEKREDSKEKREHSKEKREHSNEKREDSKEKREDLAENRENFDETRKIIEKKRDFAEKTGQTSKKSLFHSTKSLFKAQPAEIKEVSSVKNTGNLKKIGSFAQQKRKPPVSFHEDSKISSASEHSKDLLEKYLENQGDFADFPKKQLKILIKKLITKGKNAKTLDFFAKLADFEDESLQKIMEKAEKKPTLQRNLQENANPLEKNEKNQPKTRISKEIRFKSSENPVNSTKTADFPEKNANTVAKERLKSVISLQTREETAENEFSQVFYREFLRFKENNQLNLLETLIKEHISWLQAPKPEHLQGFPGISEEKAGFPRKSIASLKEVSLFSPETLAKSAENVNFSQENLMFYRRLRTEHGVRGTIASKNTEFKTSATEKFFVPLEIQEIRRNSQLKDFSGVLSKQLPRESREKREKREKTLSFQENSENFAKFKGFYHYPFNSIEKKFGNRDFGAENDASLDVFEKLYQGLLKSHQKCGGFCEHLRRFYKRIRFVGRFLRKEELQLRKNLIDRLEVRDFE